VWSLEQRWVIRQQQHYLLWIDDNTLRGFFIPTGRQVGAFADAERPMPGEKREDRKQPDEGDPRMGPDRAELVKLLTAKKTWYWHWENANRDGPFRYLAGGDTETQGKRIANVWSLERRWVIKQQGHYLLWIDDNTLRGFFIATGRRMGAIADPPPKSEPKPEMKSRPKPGLDWGGARGLAYAPTGKLLALGGEDGSLRFFDLSNGRPTRSFLAHDGPVGCLAWSRDDKWVASGGDDGEVHLWEAGTDRRQHTIEVKAAVTWLAWAPDSKSLGICSADKKLRVWDAQKAEVRFVTDAQSMGTWSGDSTTIATCGWDDPQVRLWDAASGKPGKAFELHPKCRMLAWSPDGKKLAVPGPDDNRAWLVDPQTGTVQKKSERSPQGWFEVMAWSPDGRTLAAGHETPFVILWDAQTGRPLRNLGKHDGRIVNVAWSPSGNTVATSSADKTVRVWTAAAEKPALLVLRPSPKR
jgi:WD40 repeat protein